MKNIIVTGAANGIGYHMVKQMLSKGCNVTVLDIDMDHLSDLAKRYDSLLVMGCDVRDEARVKECVVESVRKIGCVECAIHNACMCTFENMEQTAEETYRAVMDVNYFGALHLARAVLPHMKSMKHGKIIFTSSGVGVTGFAGVSPYASSKGALESLARCLNIEYRDFGISCHVFHPPLTRTKSSAPLPVPPEFMADPETVGTGLANRINKKSFIICHSFTQTLQTQMCYLFPVSTGKFLSRMTAAYKAKRLTEPPG